MVPEFQAEFGVPEEEPDGPRVGLTKGLSGECSRGCRDAGGVESCAGGMAVGQQYLPVGYVI